VSNPAYVTTSWDDGGPLDLRLAATLHRHGVRGTLYWLAGDDRWPLPAPTDTRALLDMGMEIGSHGMAHADLTRIDDAAREWQVVESRRRLQEHCGGPIRSFCYPYGRFDRRARATAVGAGYALARTTTAFYQGGRIDPFLMPVSFQLYPHGLRPHFTHALRYANWAGLRRWLVDYRAETDPVELARLVLDHIRSSGGVLHFWGHSWELEQEGLWETLDAVLAVVSGHEDVRYVTNGDLVP
jgi:peptidoglycan-N-acetylglucosamine deacetylase